MGNENMGNDNIIITPTEDNKLSFRIKCYQQEILKTQKSIKKLKKEYEEFLSSFQKAKENFCNKFDIAESKIDIVIDSEEFQIMPKFAEKKDDLLKSIQAETDYLEGLEKSLNNG
jgi:hypothetical protein